MGGGASLFQARQVTTNTETSCVDPSVTDNFFAGRFGVYYTGSTVTGCKSSSSNQVTASSTKRTAILPYITLGGGFERNAGSWFFRGDFALNEYLPMDNKLSITSIFTTYSAHAGVGYRF